MNHHFLPIGDVTQLVKQGLAESSSNPAATRRIREANSAVSRGIAQIGNEQGLPSRDRSGIGRCVQSNGFDHVRGRDPNSAQR